MKPTFSIIAPVYNEEPVLQALYTRIHEVMEGVGEPWELVLVDDSGEHVLTPGMCAGFKAGNGNGHCLQNRTSKRALYLEVGSRKEGEIAHYSDIDMKALPDGGKYKFVKKDGSSF